ncbi:MAG: diaminopimelate epimerase [Clostridia bacterium]|nr:diaminopimelate epimerase [Clostridia bacterium]
MRCEFVKMHGCGNDYVYIDAFKYDIPNPSELAIRVSDRHFGIGSDGLILVAPSDVADGKMIMFNLDGSEGKMCGNGVRCVGKFLHDEIGGAFKKDELSIETKSGIKYLKMTTNEAGEAVAARVDMGKAILKPSDIPVKLDGDMIVSRELVVQGVTYKITCVSMGNPHCVIFTDTPVEELELDKIGPYFEHNEIFPEGVNTEFVNVIDSRTLRMRVWERGSGETWACGTGTCATVVAACLNGICKKGEDVLVHLNGGDLVINYTDETVLMTGPATRVFDGFIEI